MKMASAMTSWLCTHNTKNMLLKIVHPGGRVELHDCPILASEIMLRYPKCLVAYPHVFRNPYAVVSPDTVLMLGQKFYVVPIRTLRKLQLHSPRRSRSPQQQFGCARQNPSYQFTPHVDEEKDRMHMASWFFSKTIARKNSYNFLKMSGNEVHTPSASSCPNQSLPREVRNNQENPKGRCFKCFLPSSKLTSWEDSRHHSHSSKEEHSETKQFNISNGSQGNIRMESKGSPRPGFKNLVATAPYNHQWLPTLESVNEEYLDE